MNEVEFEKLKNDMSYIEVVEAEAAQVKNQKIMNIVGMMKS